MKKSIKENIAPVIFIVIVLVLTAISAYPQRRFGGRVVEVVDGKTCVVEVPGGKLTVVLQYIEVPDPDQAMHETMRDHLEKLLLDKTIEFMPRGVIGDRTFARVFLKGVDVSQQLLRDGAAWYSVEERSSQNEDEITLYKQNESLARGEKRGVWSDPTLKPVWEYRAEKEAARKRLEKDAASSKPVVKEIREKKKPPTKPAAPVEMWANVTGAASRYDEPFGIGGLRRGFDPAAKVGFIFTPSLYLNFPGDIFLQKMETRVFYGYKSGESSVEKSTYMIAFFSAARESKFGKSNNLVITADAQKIALGKGRHHIRQGEASVKELVTYKITRAQLEKIARAQKIGVQIGGYRGRLSDESLTYINNLMDSTF